MQQLYLYWNLSTNFSLVIAYTGQSFYGFQIQKDFRTVEGEIFKVLSKLCSDVTKTSASGRTDTGVHAECQYIGFKTKKIFDINRTLFALRQLLPKDILALTLEESSLDFSPRHSAKSREYRYLFKNGHVPLYLKERIIEFPFIPNEGLFEEFRSIIIGEHDFFNFRKTGSNEPNTVRIIYDFSITTKKFKLLYDEENFTNDYFELKITASAFLYRMVRNLVGAVFEVLNDKQDINEFKKFFNGKESSFTYKPVPAKGLSLVKVLY